MIVVKGVTYRIDRTEPHRYSVVRLLDDREIGTFQTLPALRVHPLHVEVDVMRDVVRAALRSARTSAVMHAAPVYRPDEPSSDAAASSAPPERFPSAAPARVPSSAPPPSPVMV
jgi:hypothetical protein